MKRLWVEALQAHILWAVLFGYCFMIRLTFVAAFISFLATACSSYAQPAETPAAKPEATEAPAPATVPVNQPGTEPTDPDVMYRVFAGEILGGEGDLAGAAGEYLEAAMESDDPAIAMRATRVAFAAQAWLQAAMAADRWAQLAPASVPARESAALAMLATADYVGAEAHLLQLLVLSPDKDAAWTLVSQLLAKSASPEKAEKVLDHLLAEQGEKGSAAAYFAQSQLAVRVGDLARAYQLARKAVELQPGRVDVLSWAGRLALNQGDQKAGIEYMRLAWEAKPEDHDLTLAYADLLARDGQQEAARILLQEMVQTPDVMLTRIIFELGSNQVQAAFDLYSKFQLMSFPDTREKAFFLAQAAESLDRLTDAIEFYQQVDDGEHFPAATARRAELMAMKGDLEGARETLAILRLNPDPVIVEQSWLTEARILQQAGDNKSALQSLDMALEQSPTSIPVRYAHALLAAELGEVEITEIDLRLILVEQPDNATALNALGYTLADQTDRYTEAEDLIRRAYALQPGDASITDSMGWVAYRLGRLEEAEKFLTDAWELDKNPEIAAHLGEVLWRLGKKEEARVVWNEGLAVDGSNALLKKTIERLDDQP